MGFEPTVPVKVRRFSLKNKDINISKFYNYNTSLLELITDKKLLKELVLSLQLIKISEYEYEILTNEDSEFANDQFKELQLHLLKQLVGYNLYLAPIKFNNLKKAKINFYKNN